MFMFRGAMNTIKFFVWSILFTLNRYTLQLNMLCSRSDLSEIDLTCRSLNGATLICAAP